MIELLSLITNKCGTDYNETSPLDITNAIDMSTLTHQG